MWRKKSQARWRGQRPRWGTGTAGAADAAGGWWGGNHVRKYHAVTNHIAITRLSLICQPSATQPLHVLRFYTFPHRSKDISLHGSTLLSQTSEWVAHVRSQGQGCDWKWQKRISGLVEGASGRPAAEDQLVSGPASPVPSVSHLLHPQGGPALLPASLSFWWCYNIFSLFIHNLFSL